MVTADQPRVVGHVLARLWTGRTQAAMDSRVAPNAATIEKSSSIQLSSP